MQHPAEPKTMLGIDFAADDALFGTTGVEVAGFDPLEPPASREDALIFQANWIELTPGGIRMELETAVMRFQPEHWDRAWSAIRGGNRILRGEEVTDDRLKFLIGFRPPGYQGGRGRGKEDQAKVDYLINAVNGTLAIAEGEGTKISVRAAVEMVMEGFRETPDDFEYPALLPPTRKLVWPNALGDPSDPKASDRLRDRLKTDRKKAN